MTAPARRRIRRQYPDTAEVARSRVVSQTDVVGSGLTVAVAESLLRTARAYDHVALRQLDEHLRQWRDALTAPAIDCPWVLARVAR